MNVRRVVRALAATTAGVACLILGSLFLGDRQLSSPFEQVNLEPVDVPVGTPLAEGHLLFSSNESGSFEIYLQSGDGMQQSLTSDAGYDSWRPRLSPDRSTILFYRTPTGTAEQDAQDASLWMMTAQGGDLVEVLPPGAHGWTRHGGAEWSPSGNELVMMGERQQRNQIWVTTPDGRSIRALVGDDNDNTDPSWDPTGERVLYVGCPEPDCVHAQREVYTVRSAGGDRIRITTDSVADSRPVFSPDGSQIAVRSQVVVGDEDGVGDVWDIRVFPTNRATDPVHLVGDDSISHTPVWLDTETVAFGRTSLDGATEIASVRVAQRTVTVLVDAPGDQTDPAPG